MTCDLEWIEFKKNREMIDMVWLGQKPRSIQDKTQGKNSLTFQEKFFFNENKIALIIFLKKYGLGIKNNKYCLWSYVLYLPLF